MTRVPDRSPSRSRGPASDSDSRDQATATWLCATGLATGILLLYLPGVIDDRRLALVATGLLIVTLVLGRLSGAAAGPRLRVLIESAGLLTHAALFGFAAHEPGGVVLTLYILPLAAAALVLGPANTAIVVLLIAILLLFELDRSSPLSLSEPATFLGPLLALLPLAAGGLLVASLGRHVQGAERRISDLSATDSLTGLLNVRAFKQALAREHRRAERQGNPYSLMVVDIDKLRELNESLGYEAGNELLQAVAQSIARSIRASDVAARLGGDEFVVLLCDADPRIANAIGQRVRNNVYGSTVSIEGRMVRASVALGIVSFPRDLPDSRALLNLALRRLEQEKALRQPV